ncbi:MAG: InlB B-repeat-containing protein [Dehalococcoidia bacterium]|nr:InlB B-repeat-containing protein [Dehalococcoidia bacterium]
MSSSLEGYCFDHWSGDVSGTSPVATVVMNADKHITAHFKPSSYSLKLQVNPYGSGLLNPLSIGTHKLNSNTGTVILTATPTAGYTFDSWTGDATGKDNPLSVDIDSNKDITANFNIIINTLDVYVFPPQAGLVNRGYDSREYIEYGTVIKLVAAPSQNYTFDHWEGAVAGTSDSVSFAITSDAVITACFKPKSYHLTIYTDPSEGGTVIPAEGDYSSDSALTLTATPAEGYVFSHWAGAASGTSPSISIVMDSDKAIAAQFRLIN